MSESGEVAARHCDKSGIKSDVAFQERISMQNNVLMQPASKAAVPVMAYGVEGNKIVPRSFNSVNAAPAPSARSANISDNGSEPVDILPAGVIAEEIVPDTQRTPVPRFIHWRFRAEALQINCRLENQHLILENFVSLQHGYVIGPETRSRHIGRESVQTTKVDVCLVAEKCKKTRGRPKKITVNRLKPYLSGVIFLKDALKVLPMFDDIVTGAVTSDAGGNTRPYSKERMVHFLQGLDVIAAEAVMNELGGSLRNAQKVAMCLRIIERHAFSIAKDCWPLPVETNWDGID